MWLGKWRALGLLALWVNGCAAPAPPRVCVPGEMRGCSCNDGREGAQRCDYLGERFDACYCETTCTPECGGIACGPPRNAAACPGVTCGECGAGFSCSSGQCVRQPSPCAGRSCGLGTDGLTSCGTCGSGLSCSGGTCVRGSSCSRQPGASCATHADCCPDGATPVFCEDVWGWGRICTAQCLSNANCGSACCARFDDGNSACADGRFCAATTGCTRAIDEACSGDWECCRDPRLPGVPTACAAIGGAAVCRSMCRSNADCASACCAARPGDGKRVCAAASACR